MQLDGDIDSEVCWTMIKKTGLITFLQTTQNKLHTFPILTMSMVSILLLL